MNRRQANIDDQIHNLKVWPSPDRTDPDRNTVVSQRRRPSNLSRLFLLVVRLLLRLLLLLLNLIPDDRL